MKTFAIEDMPFAGTVPSPKVNGENEGMITGNWRVRRPVVAEDECTQCMTCWIFCPDACVQETETAVTFNLKYCKGCGLCAETCPTKIISLVPELDFED
jgi:2-oxoacid:acceptor oxidoreductase delta subunit (pyruvate/2-ketoisovalerate family)